MSAEDFVADPASDELQQEILLLERHIRQSTGSVPQGTCTKTQHVGQSQSQNILLNDAATRKLNGNGGNRNNRILWREPGL